MGLRRLAACAVHANHQWWRWGACALLGLLPTAGLAADPPPLSKAEQVKVDAAIRKGVEFLKHMQKKDGTWKSAWDKEYPPGLTILCTWTLLECGEQPTDPAVQSGIAFLRANARKLRYVYNLTLAILILDKLGDPKDEALIRSLALRLIAGQQRVGGWYYTCPSLSEDTERSLWDTLRKVGPLPIHAPARPGRGTGRLAPEGPIVPSSTPPLKGVPARSTGENTLPHSSSSPGSGSTMPSPGTGDDFPGRGVWALPRLDPKLVPAELRVLSIFHDPRIPLAKGKGQRRTIFDLDKTENTNLPFAAVGLWVARRHGVPTDRTFRLMTRYLEVMQKPDGSWPYAYHRQGATGQAMIGMGLIGLAIAHADRNGMEKKKMKLWTP